MGNTDSANLDAARNKSEQRIATDVLYAIEQNDAVKLKQMLQFDSDSYWMNAHLNKEEDTALIYAVKCGSAEVLKLLLETKCDIQACNKDGQTALDVSVSTFCKKAEKPTHLDPLVLELIKYGATGSGLSNLILHYMKNESLILEIIHVVPNLYSQQYYKYSGLLLQSSVWFDYKENVKCLLKRGVNVQAYWDVPFMPQITPNSSFNYQEGREEEAGGAYSLPTPPSNEAVQQTKLSLVHDWRNDWNDGQNPEAIFRAGLQLPINYLNIFIRTAIAQETYIFLVGEIFRYPPVESGGPSIKSCTFKLLVDLGYIFTENEQSTLIQKYQVPQEVFKMPFDCHTLKHICRNVIRNCGRANVLHFTEQLNLPLSLKLYILFSDIDDTAETVWLLQ